MAYKLQLLLIVATLSSRAEGLTNAVNAWAGKPFICIIGDSIPEGWSNHYSFGDGGPTAASDFEVGRRLWVNAGITTTNFAHGGYHWSDMDNATYLGYVTSSNPSNVLIHCGANDVYDGNTWSSVLAHINSISSILKASGLRIIIEDIFPAQVFSDAQALTVRQWNSNIVAWASTNAVTVLQNHDALGQTRASTGRIDDLNSAYLKTSDSLNIHLNTAGVDYWSTVLISELRSIFAIPPQAIAGVLRSP